MDETIEYLFDSVCSVFNTTLIQVFGFYGFYELN